MCLSVRLVHVFDVSLIPLPSPSNVPSCRFYQNVVYGCGARLLKSSRVGPAILFYDSPYGSGLYAL